MSQRTGRSIRDQRCKELTPLLDGFSTLEAFLGPKAQPLSIRHLNYSSNTSLMVNGLIASSTAVWWLCNNDHWRHAFDRIPTTLLSCREDFTRHEAEAFVKEAVALAMASDCSSGGCMRFVTIDSQGTHHVYVRGDEVPYKDMPQPISAAAAAGMILG